MRLVDMNCLSVLVKKLAGVRGGIIVEKVQVFLKLPMVRGVGGGLCEIFQIDLDPGYEASEHELSRYVG